MTGKSETIERDCVALAPSATAIYYAANYKNTPVLRKISDGKVETVSSISGYDQLYGSNAGRWIALAGRGKSAVFDTSSDQISAKSTCKVVTVLSNGTPLYVRGAELSSDPAVCVRPR